MGSRSGRWPMFAIDSMDGSLHPLAGSPLAAGPDGYSIAINPVSAFAYATSVDLDTVTAYPLDPVAGGLTVPSGAPAVGTDAEPMFIAIDPSGKFAYTANYIGGNISAFTLNPVTGALTADGAPFSSGAG